METMKKTCLTVEELRQHLNCSATTAYRLVHSEGFPTFKIGRKILIPVDKLNEWIERQSEGGSRG